MEKEADLQDYLQFFWKRRVVFFSIPAISMFVALLIILLGPRMYKLELFIEIGKICDIGGTTPKTMFIEEPQAIVERLKNIYEIDNAVALSPAPIIQINLGGFKKEEVTRQVKGIKEEILIKHQEKYARAEGSFLAYLQELENKIMVVKAEIKKLEQRQPGEVKDPLWKLNIEGKSVVLERKDYLWDLQNKLTQYKNIIKNQTIFSSRIINPALDPKVNFKWPVVLLAISFGGGILLAIFIAFVKEMRGVNNVA